MNTTLAVHFVLPEDAPAEQYAAEPGMVIRTACGEIDYVDHKGRMSFHWAPSDGALDSITCAECAAIAEIKMGQRS